MEQSDGSIWFFFFFFQAEDGIRDVAVTGVQTCALPISHRAAVRHEPVACAGGILCRRTVGSGDGPAAMPGAGLRSGERRVGEEGRSRGAADHLKKKKK